MRIVHISTYDMIGGAARAAYRLHRGLLRLGHDSSMFVLGRQGNDSTVLTVAPRLDLISCILRRVRREWIAWHYARYRKTRPIGCDLFSDDRSEYGHDLSAQLPSYDVIHLHWVARFVDYFSFFHRLRQNTAIVWTLHDMNPFTGGCHYDLGCGRYRGGCGTCPQLGSKRRRDLSYQIWERKKRAFDAVESNRFHIVATSRWMAVEAESSPLLARFPLTLAPLGLDTDAFLPRDRRIARCALDIPESVKAILFVSHSLSDRRKGFSLLVEALNRLGNHADLWLISIGAGKPELETKIPHLHLGYVGNERLLSLIYSAADLLVVPSLQEAFGQTVLEAMACGTPVVGFAVGGIPDMVRPGVTGLLAPSKDVGALCNAIAQLVEDQAERTRMSANCRRIAVEEYALEIQAQRYVKLYKNVIENHGAH